MYQPVMCSSLVSLCYISQVDPFASVVIVKIDYDYEHIHHRERRDHRDTTYFPKFSRNVLACTVEKYSPPSN